MDDFLDWLTIRFLGAFTASLNPLSTVAGAYLWVLDTTTGLARKAYDAAFKPITYTVDLTKKTYGDDRVRVILQEGSCSCHGQPEPWSQHRKCVLDTFEGGRQMAGGAS